MRKLVLFCLVAVFITSATIPARAVDWSFKTDKQWHLGGGTVEGIAFQTFYEMFFASNYPELKPVKRHLYAFGLAVATGTFFNVLKEATDSTFSNADLSYGTAGLIAGATATIFVFKCSGDFKDWKFGE